MNDQAMPSAAQLMAAMSAAMQLIAELPDDEKLRIDTIEGETPAFDYLDAYAVAALADTALIKQAKERIRRIEERMERRRDVVAAILERLQLRKIERPLVTASLGQRTEIVEVPTNEPLPAMFIRTAHDRILIGKTLRQGGAVPGYALQDKPDLTLTLKGG
jgi:hypothetical protein